MREETRRSAKTDLGFLKRDRSPKESDYKRKLMKKLRQIPSSYWYSHQAGSIRGISDIIGCVNGVMVVLEVKRSLEEYRKKSPRTALQEKFLSNIRSAKGYGSFIYPENEEKILSEIQNLHQ